MIQKLRQSTWVLPVILGFATLTGLILALVAEGVWDWISWGLVALPLLVVIKQWLVRG